MGKFINIGNAGFREARNGEYVDKSRLISVVNKTLCSERKFSCVTRARRFGKSMAAKMLCAYYDQSCDSRELFADLTIVSDATFEEHLNKYSVIYLDLSSFIDELRSADTVENIKQRLRADAIATFPQVEVAPDDDLMGVLYRIVDQTGRQFFFIIDEWDAICREFPVGSKVMDEYVAWLRRMFKSIEASRVFAGVYMTGILPIKKYNTQSALNNFREYSMIDPSGMASYFGFLPSEVQKLAAKYGVDYDELEKWYDGYQIGSQTSIFNPNSVIEAVYRRHCRSYWGATAAFTNVADYIKMDFEGLQDDIIRMLAGQRVPVDPTMFQNDLNVVTSRDDVLTVLIHLGYLSYDRDEQECYIPNREVAGELEHAVRFNNWQPVTNALQASKRLMQALFSGDAEAVARGVEAVHSNSTSVLSYNDENSMACVLSLAFYYARNDYHIHREYATGHGFADLVFLPRKNVSKPAIIIELKCDQNVLTAIDQIHNRRYPEKVSEYTGDLLLVGISYDRSTKQHSCIIERMS